jgi:hypothetical protein
MRRWTCSGIGPEVLMRDLRIEKWLSHWMNLDQVADAPKPLWRRRALADMILRGKTGKILPRMVQGYQKRYSAKSKAEKEQG